MVQVLEEKQHCFIAERMRHVDLPNAPAPSDDASSSSMPIAEAAAVAAEPFTCDERMDNLEMAQMHVVLAASQVEVVGYK